VLLAAVTLVVELPARAIVALLSGRRGEARAAATATWHYVRYLTGVESPSSP
jgi:hypothetical protein